MYERCLAGNGSERWRGADYVGEVEVRERAVGLYEAAAAALGDACGRHHRGLGVFGPSPFEVVSGLLRGMLLSEAQR